ncbi:autotransporter-associated beta strand repeat-containing protein [Nocardiopsis aegyptia]|uniref:Uncharacterized protein n=1 Tax=Nocardiopsis aegyptia TaxID=220378 RepID=A0A7Z0ESW5_9ACTN|nr:autotransporter-associated beta strand repeat-containing protein [Nocardiopsis aegyptia]NYJ37709.1 hypothetical protein [Nocardiopsis aegyptia]
MTRRHYRSGGRHGSGHHSHAEQGAFVVPSRASGIPDRGENSTDRLSPHTNALYLAAAILSDPDNADHKAASRTQAESFFLLGADRGHALGPRALRRGPLRRSGGQRTDLPAPAHVHAAAAGRGGAADRVAGPGGPVGETRQPYLDAEQRRAVLRSTALSARYEPLDGPEGWGRLDLFRAADGYGAFEDDVRVHMDSTLGGLHAADTWRNDVDGSGGLTRTGSGTLTLTGRNARSGPTATACWPCGAPSGSRATRHWWSTPPTPWTGSCT